MPITHQSGKYMTKLFEKNAMIVDEYHVFMIFFHV